MLQDSIGRYQPVLTDDGDLMIVGGNCYQQQFQSFCNRTPAACGHREGCGIGKKIVVK